MDVIRVTENIHRSVHYKVSNSELQKIVRIFVLVIKELGRNDKLV